MGNLVIGQIRVGFADLDRSAPGCCGSLPDDNLWRGEIPPRQAKTGLVGGPDFAPRGHRELRPSADWDWVWDWDWATQGPPKRHPRATHAPRRGRPKGRFAVGSLLSIT